MKNTPAFASLFLLSIASFASADTFTLKDGTTLEGKILSEDAQSYTLEVQVTKSIKDERKIAKADVEKVVTELPDAKAYEPIAKMLPTPDFLTEADYLARINQVGKFIKDHPTSSRIREANKILATLKAEAGTLAAGGVKSHGKLLTADEYKANAYDLDARVMEAKIRSQLASNQLLAALRTFVDFDRDYRTTLAYGAISPAIKQAIQAYTSEANESLETFDARVKEREAGLSRMASEDRAATAGAIAEETEAIAARYKSEKDAKEVWVTSSPFHKESLTDVAKFGTAELTRLAAVKTVLGVDGGKIYRDLYTAVRGGADAATVTAAVTAAKEALIPARYISPLEDEAKGRP